MSLGRNLTAETKKGLPTFAAKQGVSSLKDIKTLLEEATDVVHGTNMSLSYSMEELSEAAKNADENTQMLDRLVHTASLHTH